VEGGVARRSAGGVKARAHASVGATERHPAAVGRHAAATRRASSAGAPARAASARAEEGDGLAGPGPRRGARARARDWAGRLRERAEKGGCGLLRQNLIFQISKFNFKCNSNFKPIFEQEESILWTWPKNKSCSKLNSLQL
jgi:hypothetical protein